MTLLEATAYADSTSTLAEVRGCDMTSVTRSCESDRDSVVLNGLIKNCAQENGSSDLQHLYLQGWLAVGHCGGALSVDDDWHMEAVVGEGCSCICHTEGLSQGVPGFLAEDRVHQLDDLVLSGEHMLP